LKNVFLTMTFLQRFVSPHTDNLFTFMRAIFCLNKVFFGALHVLATIGEAASSQADTPTRKVALPHPEEQQQTPG
jgi:hypothetical protein